MTSNIGAQKITGSGRKSLGFADGKPEDAAERTFEQIKADVMAELKTAVRPEFLNRIDDIIVFNRLNEDEIAQIADGMLRKVACPYAGYGDHHGLDRSRQEASGQGWF